MQVLLYNDARTPLPVQISNTVCNLYSRAYRGLLCIGIRVNEVVYKYSGSGRFVCVRALTIYPLVVVGRRLTHLAVKLPGLDR
jgi:hypothetical protein